LWLRHLSFLGLFGFWVCNHKYIEVWFVFHIWFVARFGYIFLGTIAIICISSWMITT
jgi:hypothetical protein